MILLIVVFAVLMIIGAPVGLSLLGSSVAYLVANGYSLQHSAQRTCHFIRRRRQCLDRETVSRRHHPRYSHGNCNGCPCLHPKYQTKLSSHAVSHCTQPLAFF